MEKIKLNEESQEFKDIKARWRDRAAEINSVEQLTLFVNHLTKDYEHDYGTIVHATEMAMIATFNCMNRSEQGGMTGFQVSCLVWPMINLLHGKSEGGGRILKYHDLLYPQHEDRFTTISKEIADWLKEEAQKNLDQKEPVHPDVQAHWEKLAKGEIPFGLRVSNDD